MRGATSVVEKDLGQTGAGMTNSSGSDPSVQAGFVQLLQKAAQKFWMRSIDVKGLFRKLGRNNKRNALSVCGEDGTRRVLHITAERCSCYG